MADSTRITTTTALNEIKNLEMPTTIYTNIKLSQLSAYPSRTIQLDDLFLISKYNEFDNTYTSYKINYQDLIPAVVVNSMLCNVHYNTSTEQLVFQFNVNNQLCSISATISDWIQPYSAGNSISIDTRNKIHTMYVAGKGVNFCKDGVYTTICADINAISAQLSNIGSNISVQGNNGICVSLSNNMYTICADYTQLCTGLFLSDYMTHNEFNDRTSVLYNTIGLSCQQIGNYCHAEGFYTTAFGDFSHSEGVCTNAFGKYVNIEEWKRTMFGREYECAHAEGISTVAYARGSHSEGVCTSAFGMYSHVEGLSCCTIDLDIEGLKNRHGTFAHAEGLATSAVGNDSHAEGDFTYAEGYASHTEGCKTSAFGNYSHAEGINNVTFADQTHAEGGYNYVSGDYSHIEGYYNKGIGIVNHIEGRENTVSANYCHVEGISNIVPKGHNYSYCYNGDYKVQYASNGEGTFNINPINGISGVYIGTSSLYNIIQDLIAKSK